MLGWFRRHAIILMVFLGSGAMVIFGLGPVFDSWARGGGGGGASENPVVATWVDGSITRNDLQILKARHYSAHRFLDEVVKESSKRKDNYMPLTRRLPRINAATEAQEDEQLLTLKVYAEKARREGFVASDLLVNSYIAMLSADAGFSQDDLKIMNRNVNQRVSLNLVKEQLKDELLFMQVQDYLFDQNQTVVNPTEAMELYHRTADQIKCQVLPIRVENKLAQVTAKPSPAEIKKLYEEGKLDMADPEGKKPGFKIKKKANVQYFVASLDKFLDAQMDELTEKEIEDEYNRLVAEKNFIVMEPVIDDNSFEMNDLPPELPGVTKPPGGDPNSDPENLAPENGEAPDDVDAPPMIEDQSPEKESASPEGETPKSDPESEKVNAENEEVGEGAQPDVSQPKPEEAPTNKESDSPNSDKNEPVESEAEKTESTTPKSEEAGNEAQPENGGEAESANKPDESPEKPASESEGGQSRAINQLKYQFVSTGAQEPDANPSSESSESSQESTEAPVGESEVEANQEEPEIKPPPQQDPQPNASGDTETTESNSDTDQEAPGQLPLGLQMEDEADKPQEKVKPLKDVVGTIKRRLSMSAAQAAMDEAITKASVEVQNYYATKLQFEFNPQPGDTMPTLDYKDIAKRYNLEAKESGLVNVDEFREDSLGGIDLPRFGKFADAIFMGFEQKEEFDTQAVGGNYPIIDQYLYWFSEKVDSRVPDLKECEDDIIKFWRQREAVKLAFEEAEAIKKKINSDQSKKMSEVYPDTTVETGAFTWLNNEFGGTISTVINVDSAGDEFMETAFSLGEMEAGVAINATNKTVYVIQSLSGTNSPEDFGTDYIENQFMRFQQVPVTVRQAANYYSRQSTFKINESIRDELKLKLVE
ncbi:MAG: hypothetical protein AAFN77_01455 [Planctomycetota bacterium]